VNDIHDAARMQPGELVVARAGCVALLGALGGVLIAIDQANAAINRRLADELREAKDINDEHERRR
jgi:hypothetical protein